MSRLFKLLPIAVWLISAPSVSNTSAESRSATIDLTTREGVACQASTIPRGRSSIPPR